MDLIYLNRSTYQAMIDSEARNGCIEWLRTDKIGTAEDQVNFYWNQPEASQYWHIENDQEKIVGICGLTSIIEKESAEFSLLIYPDMRSKGYGETALKDLLDKGFNNMGLKLIYGETYMYPKSSPHGLDFVLNGEHFRINPAWTIFKKVGFNIDGILRKRKVKSGVCVDSLVFSMSKERWRQLKAL